MGRYQKEAPKETAKGDKEHPASGKAAALKDKGAAPFFFFFITLEPRVE